MKREPALSLLVGRPGDEHTDHLERVLSERGRVQTVRCSMEDMPASSFVCLPSGLMTIDGTVVNKPCSGLWRRPGTPKVGGFAPEYQRFVDGETWVAFVGGLTSLDIRWVNDPIALTHAESKLVQLRVASTLGLPIPDTLVTNSPADAIAFSGRHRRLVVKPIRYGLVATDPAPRIAWTTPARRADLELLAGPPVILQERLRAEEHLRVVTVGQTCHIHHRHALSLGRLDSGGVA
jgi:hypothetical protein